MSKKTDRPALEMWAGVECTVNRVGDTYFDQVETSGHARRISDLDRFARLGIRAIRYPVLWERTAPEGIAKADWSWPDERLGRLRALGVRPIVGLVHHGSGPRSTSLTDESFADGLAAYAGAVAARYPWVDAYTPVNEPLTTARFSGLYGHWYPHGHDDATFLRALLIECRATVLAMRAIRRTRPDAQLVQTEDLGRVYSTPQLAHQADFENERRWLSFDLLCGRVDERHPMWGYLRGSGIPAADVAWFQDNPCPPDVLGINTYITSERFLDERADRYPPEARDGAAPYVDIAAVHVLERGGAGHAALIREAWQRYGLPVALTEVHLGCTREEQLRWLLEAWDSALAARDEGADVRAVTAWSLLGAYDWDSLLTRREESYEPGIFDLRSREPRPTALAELVRQLATGEAPDHPAAGGRGWWRRPHRFFFGADLDPRAGEGPAAPQVIRTRFIPRRPILVTGGDGALAQAFARACEVRNLACRLLSHRELDVADIAAVDSAVAELRPWAVVNAAGYTDVDRAEREPLACMRTNRDGARALSLVCAAHDVQLVAFSSALVFDGARRDRYLESDPVAPLGVYGRSQAEAERRILSALPEALVLRAGAFFSPWDEQGPLAVALRALARGEEHRAPGDATLTPAYIPDVVSAALDLLIDGEGGRWHLTNGASLTWADLVRRAAEQAGLPAELVRDVPAAQLGGAPRPRNCALGSERATLLPPLGDAIERFIRHHAVLAESRVSG